MPRYRNEDNVCLMFQRFFHMCETKEQQAIVLDMEQAFLKIPLADVVPREEAEKWKNAMMGECMLTSCILRDEFMREAEIAVAKKIFKEIEKLIQRYCNETSYSIGDMVYDIKDLQEKYTKGGAKNE